MKKVLLFLIFSLAVTMGFAQIPVKGVGGQIGHTLVSNSFQSRAASYGFYLDFGKWGFDYNKSNLFYDDYNKFRWVERSYTQHVGVFRKLYPYKRNTPYIGLGFEFYDMLVETPGIVPYKSIYTYRNVGTLPYISLGTFGRVSDRVSWRLGGNIGRSFNVNFGLGYRFK